jgi:hypothetical protein
MSQWCHTTLTSDNFAGEPTVESFTYSVNSQPLYRLYNPNSGEHLWTMDKNEYDSLGMIGWKKESIAGYLFQSQVAGSDPLYRLYNHNDGNHHWTMDIVERDSLAKDGWKYEGIAGYVFASEK